MRRCVHPARHQPLRKCAREQTGNLAAGAVPLSEGRRSRQMPGVGVQPEVCHQNRGSGPGAEQSPDQPDWWNGGWYQAGDRSASVPSRLPPGALTHAAIFGRHWLSEHKQVRSGWYAGSQLPPVPSPGCSSPACPGTVQSSRIPKLPRLFSDGWSTRAG